LIVIFNQIFFLEKIRKKFQEFFLSIFNNNWKNKLRILFKVLITMNNQKIVVVHLILIKYQVLNNKKLLIKIIKWKKIKNYKYNHKNNYHYKNKNKYKIIKILI
jgi:hypothetical protein